MFSSDFMKKFKSQISKFSGKRKIIEVPAGVRDDWPVGKRVNVRDSK